MKLGAAKAVIATIAIGAGITSMAPTAMSWTPTSPQISVSVFGGTQGESGQSIAVDASGNSYIAGSFSGTSDFNPGTAVANLTSAGVTDAYIVKLNASGNYVWAVRIGGASYDWAEGIALDSSGNVYVTGRYCGPVDFDPGPGVTNLPSSGCDDLYVLKLKNSGVLLWAKRVGGTSGDRGASVTVDPSGNVYVTGIFGGKVDFDPGTGTANLTSAGSDDVFVLKLNSAGAYVWAKRVGGIGEDYGLSVSPDGAGAVYVTGWFNGTVDFNPGPGTANLVSAGAEDAFILKLSSAGNYVWAKRIGGPLPDRGLSVSVDGTGNSFTTGSFENTVDFDPGPGTANRTSGGSDDVFLVKLNSAGNYQWAARFGSTLDEIGYSVDIDLAGNPYITGYFKGTVDFNPSTATTNLTSAGGQDVFIVKLTAAGNLSWARRVGGRNWDWGLAIAVDDSGRSYTTGGFLSTADFDPGPGVVNLTTAGFQDAFLLCLNAAGSAPLALP